MDGGMMAAQRPVSQPGRLDIPRRASMADVARLAGVSAQTVSRVSNGHRVVASTREQVLAAMRELGYRPNSAARALKWGQFHTIGVILFTLSTTGNSRTVEAIADGGAARVRHHADAGRRAHPGRRASAPSPGWGSSPSTAIIVIMEVHLLDAATVTLPPGVHVVVVDSDAGDRYTRGRHRPGRRRAPGRAAPARTGPPHGLACGGPGESSPPTPRRRPGGRPRAAGRPVPRLLRGDWSAESGYRAGLALADEPAARPCSPPTTRWRSACCAPCTSRAARCPARSAWSASTTSPTRRPSSRR